MRFREALRPVRRGGRALLVLAAAIPVVAAFAAFPAADQAAAHNWGALDSAHRCTSTPDRLSQCRSPVAVGYGIYLNIDSAALDTAVRNSMIEDYNPHPIISMGPVASIGDDHEVRSYDSAYGTMNNARAWTTCESLPALAGTGIFKSCDEQLLYFNNGTYPLNYDSPAERNHMACHELGHTLGLRHNDASAYPPTFTNSCMYNGSFTSGVNTHQHDLDCIDLGYIDLIRC